MHFAREIDLHRVIFEGDSTSVINAISQGNEVLSANGNIIDNIRCSVAAFESFEFCQVHRNYNIVADALAKEAKKPFGASGLARRFA